MKATGIVRRVEKCVIIGQTEKVGNKPEFSLILIPDGFCHTVRYLFMSAAYNNVNKN